MRICRTHSGTEETEELLCFCGEHFFAVFAVRIAILCYTDRQNGFFETEDNLWQES